MQLGLALVAMTIIGGINGVRAEQQWWSLVCPVDSCTCTLAWSVCGTLLVLLTSVIWYLQRQLQKIRFLQRQLVRKAKRDAATQLFLKPGKQYGMQTIPDLRREATARGIHCTSSCCKQTIMDVLARSDAELVGFADAWGTP